MPEILGFRPGSIPDWLDKILVEIPNEQREHSMDSAKKHYENGLNEKGFAGYGKAASFGSILINLYLLDKLSGYVDNFSLSPSTTIRGSLDNLRIGEGFQKGGWGNVEDSLRLVSLGSPIAGKGLKLIRPMLVAGGPMSCAFTSTMKGILLGGRRLFAPLSAITRNFKAIKITETGFFAKIKAVSRTDNIYLKEAGAELTKKTLTDKNFGGTVFTSLVDDILRPLGIFKEHELVRKNVKSFSQAVEIVKNEDGVMLMQYFHKVADHTGGHVIAVHKTSRGVRFADQTGTFQSLEEIADNTAKLYLQKVDAAVKTGKPFEDAVLQEARVFEAKHNPIRFLDDCIPQIKEAVLIKNSVFLPLEHVPVMLRATNMNSFLNHIAIPVWEFDYSFFLWLVQKSTPPKKQLQTSRITYLVKKREGLTQRYSSGGNSDTFAMISEYTVTSGDTLLGLAKRFYGTAEAVRQIQSANPNLTSFAAQAQLPIGKAIIIP